MTLKPIIHALNETLRELAADFCDEERLLPRAARLERIIVRLIAREWPMAVEDVSWWGPTRFACGPWSVILKDAGDRLAVEVHAMKVVY
jgi:hypothetical protein